MRFKNLGERPTKPPALPISFFSPFPHHLPPKSARGPNSLGLYLSEFFSIASSNSASRFDPLPSALFFSFSSYYLDLELTRKSSFLAPDSNYSNPSQAAKIEF